MKIIYDARHIRNVYTGLARYTFSILDALLKSRIAQKITVLLDKNEGYRDNPMYHNLCICSEGTDISVEFVFIDAPLFGIKHHLNVSKYVNGSTADVYFYPHFDFPAMIDKKSIFVIHDLLPFKVKDYVQKHKMLKCFYFKQMITRALKRSQTTCVAVSHSTKQDIVQLCGGEYRSKIAVVHENVVNFFADSSTAIIPESLPEMFLLYVGDRRPHKNLKQMIDVFRILKNRYRYPGQFLLAGGNKPFGFDLDAYIENDPGIKALGCVSDPDLHVLYAKMHSLFFLSQYEGFGLPVLEAARHNKKIITSNVSSMPEVAPPTSLLLNPHASPEELAEDIHRYLWADVEIDNRDYLRRFSGPHNVREIFKCVCA